MVLPLGEIEHSHNIGHVHAVCTECETLFDPCPASGTSLNLCQIKRGQRGEDGKACEYWKTKTKHIDPGQWNRVEWGGKGGKCVAIPFTCIHLQEHFSVNCLEQTTQANQTEQTPFTRKQQESVIDPCRCVCALNDIDLGPQAQCSLSQWTPSGQQQ